MGVYDVFPVRDRVLICEIDLRIDPNWIPYTVYYDR